MTCNMTCDMISDKKYYINMDLENKRLLNKAEFISLLKKYDFINNSIRSFSKLYGIHYNTVSKYLRENNIKYNKKKSNLIRERDVTGKFVISQSIRNNDDEDKIKKILTPFIQN